MNYSKIYADLMEKARIRGKLPRGDREKHHVIPRCMGGLKGEVVHLLLREHYICHMLLVKIYPNHYGIKLAYVMMCKSHEKQIGERIVKSRMYEKLRLIYTKENLPDEIRQIMRESKLGKKASEETRRKLSEMRMGEKNNFFGKKHTEESIKKMRNSKKGRHLSPRTEFKKGEASAFKGRKHTEESKEKNRLHQLGKKWSDEQRKNFNKTTEERKNKITIKDDI